MAAKPRDIVIMTRPCDVEQETSAKQISPLPRAQAGREEDSTGARQWVITLGGMPHKLTSEGRGCTLVEAYCEVGLYDTTGKAK